MRYLPEDNLSYPVLLKIGNSSGSGFYFRNDTKFFVVTAQHVLFTADKKIRANELFITSYGKDSNSTDKVELKIDLNKCEIKKNDIADVALIEIGDMDSSGFKLGFSKYVTVKTKKEDSNIVVVPKDNLKKFSDVLISNEVFILGYPNSLSIKDNPQIDFDKPLLRKGVVAGKNFLKKTIILDCPVYYGNSGGIAIEVENISELEKKFHVIGIVSEFVPFVQEFKSNMGYTNLNFENSGYSVVVPIDTILDLI